MSQARAGWPDFPTSATALRRTPDSRKRLWQFAFVFAVHRHGCLLRRGCAVRHAAPGRRHGHRRPAHRRRRLAALPPVPGADGGRERALARRRLAAAARTIVADRRRHPARPVPAISPATRCATSRTISPARSAAGSPQAAGCFAQLMTRLHLEHPAALRPSSSAPSSCFLTVDWRMAAALPRLRGGRGRRAWPRSAPAAGAVHRAYAEPRPASPAASWSMRLQHLDGQGVLRPRARARRLLGAPSRRGHGPGAQLALSREERACSTTSACGAWPA